MSDPTKYELIQSMDSRKREMENIETTIAQLEDKIKKLKKHKEELKGLNFLDSILLKELYNGDN